MRAIDTHHLVCDFGKHKGELWTRVPVSYLKWLVNQPARPGFTGTDICKDHGADAGDLSPTLRVMGHAGSHANAGGQVAVAFHENQRAEVTTNDTAGALKNGGGKPGQGYSAVMSGMAVRRLTPGECETLQGFKRGYTAITRANGKPAADGPRYKALGNSMAVPVMSWIGRRIQECSGSAKECE
jgi:DNA (cytosine-5)-methyltransferase 1